MTLITENHDVDIVGTVDLTGPRRERNALARNRDLRPASAPDHASAASPSRGVDVGAHRYALLEDRLHFLRLDGELTPAHIDDLVDLYLRAERTVATALLLDARNLGTFPAATRRRLSELEIRGLPGASILLAVTADGAHRQAAMTVAVSALRMGTTSRVEAIYDLHMDACRARALSWLAARPEPGR